MLIICLFPLTSCHKQEVLDGEVINNSDTDKSKEFNSNDIRVLKTCFYLEDSDFPELNGFYSIEIDNSDDEIILIESEHFYIEVTISHDELKDIQELVKVNELNKLNGTNVVTSGLPFEYSPFTFEITYQDNEELYFRIDGIPDYKFNIELVRYIRDLLISKGYDEFKPTDKLINNFEINFSNGNNQYYFYSIYGINGEAKIAKNVYQNNEEIEYEIIDMPEESDVFLNDLVNDLNLYQFNIDAYNDSFKINDKDFYQIYIDFIDGSYIYGDSTDESLLSNFNAIEVELLKNLNSLFE